jgi:hypothetical protein
MRGHRFFHDAGSLLALALSVGLWLMPGGAFADSGPVVTYVDGVTQRVRAYTIFGNGRLLEHDWNGTEGKWTDLGAPPGTTAVDQPGVTSYLRSGRQHIQVFVRGANGRLFVNTFDGNAWQWSDQGSPPGTRVASAPSVAAFPSGQRIYAFVQGQNGRLFVNYLDGAVWRWSDQGVPPGTTMIDVPDAITYQDGPVRRIRVFVRGRNGRLFANSWDGTTWQWTDHGVPTGTSVASAPSVVTYLDGTQRIYAFVLGETGRLYVNFWNGTRWAWADQGGPSGVLGFGAPFAVTYRDGAQRLYAFITTLAGRLFVNHWDGAAWHWSELGTGPANRIRQVHGAVSYVSDVRRIQAFLRDDRSSLLRNAWDGTRWQWADTWQPRRWDWGTLSYFQPDVPEGGRAVAIAVRPGNDKEMVVASETGGLFRSVDGGRSWGHVDGLRSHLVRDVEYSPNEPRVLIAATGEDYQIPNGGGIWRSPDGGFTWVRPPSATPPESARCRSTNGAYSVSFEPGSNTVLVATDCGVATSTDRGVTWTHAVLDPTLPINNDKTQDRVWSILARARGKANAAADGGIWYRPQGGSWIRSARYPRAGQGWVPHAFAYSPLNDQHVFLLANANRLYQSANGGRTWEAEAGRPRLRVFVRTAQFELQMHRWTGSQWQWHEQNTPPGVQVGSPPAVVTFEGDRMYAFVRGSDGRLHAAMGDGETLTWASQGAPQSTIVVDTPAAVTFEDRIFAFVRHGRGGLARNEWNGSSWQWADHATPGVALDGKPAAVAYYDGTRRVHAFVRGTNGRLYMSHWNGSTWQWADQGTPASTTVAGSPAVITYADGQQQRIYVFVRGADGRLHVNFWDGTQWRWADQGVPSGTSVADDPGAITYLDGPQRIYVFTRGANGRLYVNYWDGSSWRWADQGTPAGTDVADSPAAATYFEDARLIYAFVRGANGRLYVNFWNGSTWQWADQGTPIGTAASRDPAVVVFAPINTRNRPGFVRTARAAGGSSTDFDVYFGDGTGLWRGSFAPTASGPRNAGWRPVTVDHADQTDVAFDAAGRLPILLASDGGLHVTADGGRTWTLAGASRSGYNALQITEVTGVHVGVGDERHLDLYYGTQDNYLYASPDGGRRWPRKTCCEGFYLGAARERLTDVDAKVTFAACGPCSIRLADAHFDRVSDFPIAPDDDNSADEPESAPTFIRPGHYVQWRVNNSQTPPRNVVKLTVNTGQTWERRYEIEDPPWGPAVVGGDRNDPTLYHPVTRPGLTSDGQPVVGLVKATSVLGSNPANVSDADGVGFGSLGIFPTNFAWYPVFAVSPADPDVLIMPDIETNQMQMSRDGGLTWQVMGLTRLVTGGGTTRFRIGQFPAVSVIAFSPVNANHIVVGTVQRGIIRSTNGGANWQRLAGTETMPMISSFYFEDDRHIIVSTYGRGLWKLELGSPTLPAMGTTRQQRAAAPRGATRPLVVDPETGLFVRLETFEATARCPDCQYVVTRGGQITDVTIADGRVKSIALSAGRVMFLDREGRQIAGAIPATIMTPARAFAGIEGAARLRDLKLPLRGLILAGTTLRGLIVSQEEVTPHRPRPPMLRLTTSNMATGIPVATPDETLSIHGSGFDAAARTPVVIAIGAREVAQVAPDATGSFVAVVRITEQPGDYEIVAEQRRAAAPLLAKSKLKVAVRDER